MVCSKCGAENVDEAQFCKECGNSLTGTAAPAAAATPDPATTANADANAAQANADGELFTKEDVKNAVKKASNQIGEVVTKENAEKLMNQASKQVTPKNLQLATLLSCAITIIGFFILPFISVGAFSFEISANGFDMTFGTVAGLTKGDITNLLAVVLPLIALLCELFAPKRPAYIVGIVCGGLEILLLIGINMYLDSMAKNIGFGVTYSLGIGFILMVICSIVLIVASALRLKNSSKAK